MIYVVFYSGRSKDTNLRTTFESNINVKPYSYYQHILSRKDYYNDIYLKSDAWQRKFYVVLRRDKWRCMYCSSKATEVHHKRYAPINIGKEPNDWLESVC